VYRIDTIGNGYLAVMEYPGLRQDAASEIEDIARQGVSHVVSLLEPAESIALGLEQEAALVNAASMSFESFPIEDMGLPRSVDDFASLSYRLYRLVDSGSSTLIHCRGGLGRSGLLAAAVLLHGGGDVEQAFARVARGRGRRVPETPQQEAWLRASHAAVISAGAVQAS
jgi:protein-tyrosine phosphatase